MPKVDTTVRELVDMVRRNELRLPEMQRPYVWSSTRVRDLLDSLYRGYPSGAILVWDTDQQAPTRELAVGQGPSPFVTQRLLLDGQQRVTSLCAVLQRQPVKARNRKKPIEILFNLDHPDGPPAESTEVDDDSESPILDVDDDTADDDLPVHALGGTAVVSGEHHGLDPHPGETRTSLTTLRIDRVGDRDEAGQSSIHRQVDRCAARGRGGIGQPRERCGVHAEVAHQGEVAYPDPIALGQGQDPLARLTPKALGRRDRQAAFHGRGDDGLGHRMLAGSLDRGREGKGASLTERRAGRERE